MTALGFTVSEGLEEDNTWRGMGSPLALVGFRLLALTTLIIGFRYLIWRYTASLNPNALWFAIPMVLAETFSFVSAGLFALNLWRPRIRTTPKRIQQSSVDVFITVYNEPPEIVRKTAEAALRINYPHWTYILDDGRSPVIKALTEELGIGYISRADNRHAKAGNINNALRVTTGDLILYLDADQIPSPRILNRVLGYFEDDRVAFVQTPQNFYNVPDGDPFGNDAAFFYGPIQQGKDGWDAAFLCGTNVVLRREALIQMGLIYYVKDMQAALTKTLRKAARSARSAAKALQADTGLETMVSAEKILQRVQATIRKGQEGLQQGRSLEEVISTSEAAGDGLSRLIDALAQSRRDLLAILADLSDMNDLARSSPELKQTRAAGRRIARDLLPAIKRQEQAIRELQEASEQVRLVVNIEETPMATISVTEDLATSVRLHALGWKSVYHSEVLARGLAPEDLDATLKQRLRWAQGTIQVMTRDNPIFKSGLSLGQRLQYFTTMFSYFYGFAALIYLLSPIVFLLTGIAPVAAYSNDFFLKLIPYLMLNQLMFIYATRGLKTLRGQQYQVGLFPLWLKAFASVYIEKNLKFMVTPKTRQTGIYLHLIKPQLIIAFLTIVGIGVGIITMLSGTNLDRTSTIANIFWGSFNLWMLSAIIRGAIWTPARKGSSPRDLSFSTHFWASTLIGETPYASLSGSNGRKHGRHPLNRVAQRSHRAVPERADWGVN
jgi:cellulose synthase (UDP-forming)